MTLTGCERTLPDPATPAPPAKVAGPPPTEAEAQEFADQMNQAVMARDAGAIDRLIRMEDLAARLVSDLGLSDAERQGFIKGASNSLKQAGMGQQILQAMGEEGGFKFLRIRTVDGRPRPLFRLLSSEGALNYHEYTLARQPDGTVANEDIFVYLSGEPLSQTLRRVLIPSLGKGWLSRFDNQEADSLKSFGTMATAVRNGDLNSAIATYRSLPQKSQEQKPILLMYMQATMNLGEAGEADYMAGMETFRRLFPHDPAIDFISIDYFALTKRYDALHRSLDRLDKAVGGDPYLDVMRGNAWMEAGQFDEARQAVEKAIDAEPDLTQAYWVRVTLALREKNHADTLQWLQTMVQKRRMVFGDMKDVPEYAEFVKSPQYGEWQKWYAGREKGNSPEVENPGGASGRQ